ncbi:HNH endonuclease signature motif containing protein [Streptomyces violaceus]|uniref:HNH endonuclease signature motif containing protein n=1 Tax=Streptomyces violaceus TaxID=1936 RepID=UPI0035C6A286
MKVHHIDDRALGGRDHPSAMIALCPNCHATRRMERTQRCCENACGPLRGSWMPRKTGRLPVTRTRLRPEARQSWNSTRRSLRPWTTPTATGLSPPSPPVSGKDARSPGWPDSSLELGRPEPARCVPCQCRGPGATRS